MQSLIINSVLAWVCINTDHGDKLEFVLSSADDRNNGGSQYHTFSEYTERLVDMVSKAGINISEYQEYGDVMLCIAAETIPELEKAITKTESVIKTWINKYRINHMINKR